MHRFDSLYHHGLIVDSLDAASQAMTATLGLDWAPVRRLDPMRVWLPADAATEAGWGEAQLSVTYSRQGPIHMELIEMVAGCAYERLKAVSRGHVGAWVDDVGDAVEDLAARGWTLILAGASPKHRFGQMAYMARDDRPVLELVGTAIRPMIAEWIAAN